MAMEPISMYSGNDQEQQQQQQEKKASQLFAQRAVQDPRGRSLKPPDQVVPCPRCQSLNTKFCYYNNYSLTQPRHFCKNCRRYWTAGGTLRNVPVGGGVRKNKRTKQQQQQQNRHNNNNNNNDNNNTDHVAITTAASGLLQQQQTTHGSNITATAAAAAGFFDAGSWSSASSSQQEAAAAASRIAAVEAAGGSPGGASLLAFSHSGQGGNELESHHNISPVPFASGIMSLGLFNSVSKPLHGSTTLESSHAAAAAATSGLSMHMTGSSQQQQQVQMAGGAAGSGACPGGGGGGDLVTAFFQNSAAAAYSTRVGNLAALTSSSSDSAHGHGHSSILYNNNNNHNSLHSARDGPAAAAASSYATSHGHDVWRNLQPHQPESHRQLSPSMQGSASLLDLNRQQAAAAASNFKASGKLNFSAQSLISVPVVTGAAGHGQQLQLLNHDHDAEKAGIQLRPGTTTVAPWQQQQQQQQQQSSSVSHHQAPGSGMANYETAGPPNTHFWSNPGWPPLDLHVLHGSGPGPRLL